MDSFGFKLLKAIRMALRIMTGSPCTCLIKVLYCSSALGACGMGIPVMDMFSNCRNRSFPTSSKGGMLHSALGK